MTFFDTVEPALGIAQATITTLAVCAVIGIAFLSRPGRATLYWSFAFTLAMTATFAFVAGDALELEPLRRVGLGALMGAPALLWSGFRALWGMRPFVWTGPVIAVAAAAALSLAPDPTAFAQRYRVIFFIASVFGFLLFLDWLRARATRRDPLVAPLAVISLAFFVLGSAVAAAGIGATGLAMTDLALARFVSSVGMLVFVSAAVVAVVGTSTREAEAARRSQSGGDWEHFHQTARARLRRAEKLAENWSLIYLSLDDEVEIRQAAGPGVLAALTRMFVREVRASFPLDADVDSPFPGTVVVFVPRGDASVRESLRTALDRISLLDVDGRLPIHPSASAGWAPTSILGYDFDTLLYMGREGALVSAEQGGDRWERVGATVTDRILNRSARL